MNLACRNFLYMVKAGQIKVAVQGRLQACTQVNKLLGRGHSFSTTVLPSGVGNKQRELRWMRWMLSTFSSSDYGEGKEIHFQHEVTVKPVLIPAYFKEVPHCRMLFRPNPGTRLMKSSFGLFSLEKKKLREDLVALCNYLKKGCIPVGFGLFSHFTRGKGFKLHQRRFSLGTMKNFFTARVGKHQGRLAEEVVESPSLKIFQRCVVAVALRDTAKFGSVLLMVAPDVFSNLHNSRSQLVIYIYITCDTQYWFGQQCFI